MRRLRRILLVAATATLLAGALDRADPDRAPLAVVACVWPAGGTGDTRSVAVPSVEECAVAAARGRTDQAWISAC